MGIAIVYQFETPATTGEMLRSRRWATKAGIEAFGGKPADGVEWRVDEKWIDVRGITVEGVHERPFRLQQTVAERYRTQEEVDERWLDGPGQ